MIRSLKGRVAGNSDLAGGGSGKGLGERENLCSPLRGAEDFDVSTLVAVAVDDPVFQEFKLLTSDIALSKKIGVDTHRDRDHYLHRLPPQVGEKTLPRKSIVLLIIAEIQAPAAESLLLPAAECLLPEFYGQRLLMTPLHLAVWNFLLERHCGIENAAPRSAILIRFNLVHSKDLNDRIFRKVVADLVTDFRKAICTTPESGYFGFGRPDGNRGN